MDNNERLPSNMYGPNDTIQHEKGAGKAMSMA